MKTDWSHLERYRKTDGPMGTSEGDHFGAFYLQLGTIQIIVIASEGSDEVPWEHVSLRARDYKGERTPIWSEMHRVKELFWSDDECVVQFHPPKQDYVNNHPNVLHLWKPIGIEMPRPPSIAVGIK